MKCYKPRQSNSKFRAPFKHRNKTMKEEKVSHTADGVAAIRFFESLKPEGKRVCCDPYAKEFVGRRFRLLVGNPFLRYIVLPYYERILPGIIGLVIARVRYIDDYLKECIDDGVEQLVILGAGYDSRAYRFEELKAKVTVFEVDHPATQKAKIEKVKKILGSLPDHVVYAGVDFTKEKLDEKLIQSGYDTDLKTLFIWEGVTMYLSLKDVDETLSFVASKAGDGSSIVFDYIYRSVLDKTCDDAIRLVNYCEKAGEPWTFGIEEGRIESFLSERGFHQIKDVNCEYLKEAYFKPVNESRKITPLAGIVHARVSPQKRI